MSPSQPSHRQSGRIECGSRRFAGLIFDDPPVGLQSHRGSLKGFHSVKSEHERNSNLELRSKLNQDRCSILRLRVISCELVKMPASSLCSRCEILGSVRVCKGRLSELSSCIFKTMMMGKEVCISGVGSDHYTESSM